VNSARSCSPLTPRGHADRDCSAAKDCHGLTAQELIEAGTESSRALRSRAALNRKQFRSRPSATAVTSATRCRRALPVAEPDAWPVGGCYRALASGEWRALGAREITTEQLAAMLAPSSGSHGRRDGAHPGSLSRSALLRAPWRPRARSAAAIVTLNPDLFTRFVSPTYGLDSCSRDLTVVAGAHAHKASLCEIALQRLAQGPAERS